MVKVNNSINKKLLQSSSSKLCVSSACIALTSDGEGCYLGEGMMKLYTITNKEGQTLHLKTTGKPMKVAEKEDVKAILYHISIQMPPYYFWR